MFVTQRNSLKVRFSTTEANTVFADFIDNDHVGGCTVTTLIKDSKILLNIQPEEAATPEPSSASLTNR